MKKQIRIALTGNPNSGKTTLYNSLTGRNEKVGNWAGVTVDKKEFKVKNSYKDSSYDIVAVDLPGAYSMSAFTNEESITKTYITNEKPDVIINIVDSTNLSRSLFFTTQLLELGIPVVVALNKTDLTKKNHINIDINKLSQLLGCRVVETISTKDSNNGLKELIEVACVTTTCNNPPFISNVKNIEDEQEVKNCDKLRYQFVNDIISKVEIRQSLITDTTYQDKLDSVLAHKYLGIPIFAVVMFVVFYLSQTLVGPFIADFLVGLIDSFSGYVAKLFEDANPFLNALLIDGIIGGVGAVIGFLPLVMVMYFLISLLEDSGYMARVAVVMDRFFKVVGLSGKSIIPMVIGTGCAIPGVMASRTIKNERERRTTVMLTPFMPCGAKLPVIALFAGVFFKDAAWVGTLMYFMGILLIIVGALIVKQITGHKNKKSFFIMELPVYKIPSLKRATFQMFDRAKSFIIKAATIILICNALVQIMQTFNWQFEVVGEGAAHTSILATIASPFAFILIPLGFGVWQLASAAITGFIAKENVVGTLAVVYAIGNFINTDSLELVGGASEVASIMNITSVVALSYLIFNLFTPPCFAAIGAMNAEMNSKKWLFAGILLQLGMAYVCSFIVYQVGTLITLSKLGAGFIPGLVAVIVIISIVLYLMIKGNSVKEEYTRN